MDVSNIGSLYLESMSDLYFLHSSTNVFWSFLAKLPQGNMKLLYWSKKTNTPQDTETEPELHSVDLKSLFSRVWIMVQQRQAFTLTYWQNLAFSCIYGARPHWVKLFLYLILLTLFMNKVICCQLTGLIGMEGKWSFGEGMRSSCTCTLGSWTRCGAYPHSLLRF